MSTDRTYDVVAVREFAVPIEEVWRAWSDPGHVQQWWGPTGFTGIRADLDFQVGGTSLVGMRAPAEFGGQDLYNTWTYHRIERPKLIEFDLRFTDGEGATIDSPPGVPSAVRHVVTFAAVHDALTSMTITEYGYAGEHARDLSKAGLDQCLDKMETLLLKTD
ncbi:SRPBCC family protein [Actinomadura rudentiformis]|uniref:SRPBCC domain-containing protein n=1 Tax=Actinomadura rudentiformis TaxID=359158 RepID=A0A6H9YUX1_9ACTN|nr:SRPBCC domain-containing protein [Actinomadura rudentiformis]KAB2352407.1 SRPBCC domain-containing protein [Actinomadura rudentiformis]